ncbi:MAG: peptidoglycan DD-metalloendopeptidase family protein, partial [bacterium]
MSDIQPPLSPIGHEQPLNSEPKRSIQSQKPRSPFKRVLSETEAGQRESLAPRIVQVHEGDTLSEIVHRALKKRDLPFSTQDLYHWVDSVAQANGLANANLIYPGQKLDLSILYGQRQPVKVAVAQEVSAPPTLVSPVNGRLTSGFGMRMHPIDHVSQFHEGVDIAAPTGTPVASTHNGVVAFAGTRGGYGNCVDIDHGDGWLTRYAHLNSVAVGVGQEIQAGSQIGTVGE